MRVVRIAEFYERSCARQALIALSVAALFPATGAAASGWHDYELEIAPGFTVFRANAFDVCLGTTEKSLLVCPHNYPGKIGPLVAYAVTEDAIITQHVGARPHEKNPEMLDADPEKEFLFIVRRADRAVSGPFTRLEWEQAGYPDLSSLNWAHPRNPNFWLPFLGTLFFLGVTAIIFGGPIAVLVIAAASLWLYLRRLRQRRNAA